MADDVGAAAGLLWEQAQRQLSQQNADLDTLRTRAIAMLSVATLVAGLFGSRLPRGHESIKTLIALIIALALFGVSVLLAILVAVPRKRWIFSFTFDQLLKLIEDNTARPVDVAYNLTRWAEEARSSNKAKLKPMYAMFGCLCVLTGLQVIAWAVALF